jgi:hypothetical protein
MANTRPMLKDEEKRVVNESNAAREKAKDDAVEELENRLLGKETSNSVKTISGGRPESNRSKF